ncbi:monovalent cation/H(+) antiporter subunit G [Roseibacillus persicicus]|uniref:monovalent cation/H(+) antiporter subunit G n=1 Tax=Roseibacillus persicicus TaxID=454148 RepID=UPI00280F1BD9|nr:monovalent cation/H(+) antiporter subunit G [Roseibacillus persicicus]MDQ8189823.1 monovalent cation/H(+) antiporter subunit G [Roseibacillus persicicus]
MISELFLLLGSLCFFIASLGLFRMPDSFCRIHAATKASSLGVTLCAIAAVLEFRTATSVGVAIAIVFLVFLTAPLACHAITRRLVPEKTRMPFTPGKSEK